jgi:hypothetical protein
MGLYLGLHRRNHPDTAGLQIAYLFDGMEQRNFNPEVRRDIGVFTEAFCVADHGMTVGYDPDAGGHYSPVLKTTARDAVWAWGYATVRQTLLSFADHLYLNPDDLDPYADVRRPVFEAFELFRRKPTAFEAQVWGSYPYEDDQCGDHSNTLAEAYNSRHIISGFVKGELPRHRVISWPQANWRLTNPLLRGTMLPAIALGACLRAVTPACLLEAIRTRLVKLYQAGWMDWSPSLKGFLRALD